MPETAYAVLGPERVWCPGCGEVRGPFDFYPDRRRPTGRRSRCKSCCNERRRSAGRQGQYREYTLRQYGLTPEAYQARFAEQCGLCAICRRPEQRHPNLAVDHDHATGRVRGLLCTDCNTGIGKLGDSPERLLRAVEYLRG